MSSRSEKVRTIVLHIEGGVVTEAFCDDSRVEIIVVDHDDAAAMGDVVPYPMHCELNPEYVARVIEGDVLV